MISTLEIKQKESGPFLVVNGQEIGVLSDYKLDSYYEGGRLTLMLNLGKSTTQVVISNGKCSL